MPKNIKNLPDWEQVLSSAARLQRILPDAILVGGTASAVHAEHRFSRDADHILPDLRIRFDDVLAELESIAGWKTARIKPPVLILGSLDGIETGIRQLIREIPLETTVFEYKGEKLVVPTEAEILRIKGILILKRNATRDYLDFIALADNMGDHNTIKALNSFDLLYPQSNEDSSLNQLQIQLSNPLPYDLEETTLADYKNLSKKWHDWGTVKSHCIFLAMSIFDEIISLEKPEYDID